MIIAHPVIQVKKSQSVQISARQWYTLPLSANHSIKKIDGYRGTASENQDLTQSVTRKNSLIKAGTLSMH